MKDAGVRLVSLLMVAWLTSTVARTRFRPPNPLQKQKIVTSFRKNDTIGLCDLRKQNKDIKPTPKARNAQVDRPTRRDTSQRSKGPSEGRSADLLQWTTTTNGSVQVESTIKKSGCKSHPGRVAYRVSGTRFITRED